MAGAGAKGAARQAARCCAANPSALLGDDNVDADDDAEIEEAVEGCGLGD